MAQVFGGPDTFFRLSPAAGHAGNGPVWFAIKRGMLSRRIDAYSNQPHFRQLFRRLYASKQRVATFAELAERIFSGITPLAKGDAYVEPPYGVRFLRSGEITPEGGVTETSEVHIRQAVHEGMMKRSQLERGDLLIAIVGATIGSVGIYDRDDPANINQAIASVRLRGGEVRREFACLYLHSSLGQRLLDFFKRPVARANINLEEIGEIPLLIPDEDKQNELIVAMDIARERRQRKLSEAEELLSSLDDFLIRALGLTPPKVDERRVFAVRLQEQREEGRLNSDYFHPERILTLRALLAASEKLKVRSLDELVDFERNQIKSPGENYLSLANVQSHTGELTDANENVTGTCFTFNKDDVLFARLRPYLNKVYLAEMYGCCSPEFHVLRIKDNYKLLPEYLAAILRSRLTLSQTIHMMTGNTHPRLANEDVVNLKIPVPKIQIQETIIAEIHLRREEARRLKAEGEEEWQAAKRWFDEQLLGGCKA
jgi:hypothetical protein